MGLLIGTGYQIPGLMLWEERSAPEACLLFATTWRLASPLNASIPKNRISQ